MDHVSTGHLPPTERVQALVDAARARYAGLDDGTVADYIPALAHAAPDRFGICVAGVDGRLFATGDATYEFSIQSVAKPFVFALVCQAIGPDLAREKLGVNSTGLPFDPEHCTPVLAVLATAGLYERSGEWLYDVGLPGKSGVSGGLVTISPGKGGLGTYSPRLDHAGNSIRGAAATRYLSRALGLNLFASTAAPRP